MEKLKLGILGSGRLAEIVVDAYVWNMLEGYELVGVLGRTGAKARALADKGGCSACGSLEELLEKGPDVIAELASVQAVRDYGERILSAGINLVILSAGALADEVFYERIRKTAIEHQTRVYIASGTMGGYHMLQAISLMGPSEVFFITQKGPSSLEHTPLYEEALKADGEERMVFTGSTGEAVAVLPDKVNVAAAVALASVGTEKARVDVISVPGMTGDRHRVVAKTEGVKLVVDAYSGTSDIAGWSVVDTLRNMVSPVVF